MFNLFTLSKTFSTETDAIKYLYSIRWGDNGKNYHCPHCNSTKKHYTQKEDLSLFRCSECQKNFTVKVGTIFEDSKLPLQKWFYAIYLLNVNKKGISSIQLAKDIDVTQKTAYFMLQKIRYAIEKTNENQLNGEVEIDEAYIGGSEYNKHASKKIEYLKTSKFTIIGMLQRNGDLILEYVDKLNKTSLKPLIANNVSDSSIVFTDESVLYNTNTLGDRIHLKINHSNGEYVRHKHITTNSIEGVFGNFKRVINGIYHHVSKKHINKYAKTFAFKYNYRERKVHEQFNITLATIIGIINPTIKVIIESS